MGLLFDPLGLPAPIRAPPFGILNLSENEIQNEFDQGQIIDGLVISHSGRVFGTAGDSVIAEFMSPVEAVRCAVKIQQNLEKSNADLPKDSLMCFRIGGNLGDVMVDG